MNDDEELSCQNELLRNIEKTLVYGIKQFNDLGDDILEPYFRLSWKVEKTDHGVVVEHHAGARLSLQHTDRG